MKWITAVVVTLLGVVVAARLAATLIEAATLPTGLRVLIGVALLLAGLAAVGYAWARSRRRA